MSDVVWSINIMLAILLIAVGYVIFWIFKYDDWNPNPVIHSNIPHKSKHNDSGNEKLEI